MSDMRVPEANASDSPAANKRIFPNIGLADFSPRTSIRKPTITKSPPSAYVFGIVVKYR